VPYTKDKLNKADDVRKSNVVGESRNHYCHGNTTVLSNYTVVYYMQLSTVRNCCVLRWKRFSFAPLSGYEIFHTAFTFNTDWCTEITMIY
jgi:hypothetical protein